MAASKKIVRHATYVRPRIIKEIINGLSLRLFAGGLWKMHHSKNQKTTKEFYDLLDKGEISVVVEEE